ncbi:flavin-dependent L-tryptophan oxidase RebO precursor [Oxobacter pfennigii]|uniref:Flavin-dependent L-tryptophan oxidase RebO n=1 Tax=Oxobacter pfennigii TaxID=36849 RepID=A0A0N8NT51_9CLOT|nr:NAD(P)/FAD-dependent oxidoreductase [Oxobacter pfennigii]KPU43856.1 flavin-dependent L-tryptophan oxidase RebO precursor [Oxobacter pfennigii]
MCLIANSPPQKPIQSPNNPTDAQRHEMVKQSLINAGRPEDYKYIMENLSPPPDITTYAAPGQYKGIKVAVVGAGIAGLSAAFELRKLGFDITIFEAEEERIGGRIYTHYFDKDKRLYGELGAGRIPASHGTAWHYVNLFNLNTTRIGYGKDDTFVFIRNTRARYNAKDIMEQIYPMFNLTPAERNTPWPELYDRVILSALKSLSPELRAEFIRISPNLPPTFATAVTITVRQGLKKYGLSDSAISLITSLSPTVNAFIEGSFYTELITDYAVSTNNTYRIDGGMANLPLAFYRSLTSDNPQEYNLPSSALGKAAFKRGSLIEGCYKSDKDGKVILSYYNKLNAESAYESFDYVFFTVPLTSLRKIYFKPAFSNLKTEAIREVSYVDAQKVLFLCSERFWQRQGITGGVSNTDLIIQSIMYPSDSSYCQQNTTDTADCSPNVPGVLVASYTMGNDAQRLGSSKPFLFRLTKRQVEIVHGLPKNYLENVVTDYKAVHWNDNPYISGAFVNFQPGQGNRFSWELSKPEYENRVYFSGEAISPPNGWIQAALQSSMISANALAYYLKTYGHKK